LLSSIGLASSQDLYQIKVLMTHLVCAVTQVQSQIKDAHHFIQYAGERVKEPLIPACSGDRPVKTRIVDAKVRYALAIPIDVGQIGDQG
jgi:hypothetical protein